MVELNLFINFYEVKGQVYKHKLYDNGKRGRHRRILSHVVISIKSRYSRFHESGKIYEN